MGKRIALISDIHGNIEALNNVLNNISKQKIDKSDIYSIGDLVGYGPRPSEVVQLIIDNNIQSVLGNYDEAVGFYLPTCGCSIESKSDKIRTENSLSWTDKNTSECIKEYLRTLEEEISLEIEGYKLLLTHGSPISINDYIFEHEQEKQEEIADELEEDILISGHTHFPYFKNINNKLFINPGSVGRPKDGDNRACYCIVEFGEKINVEFIRVSYDIEKVAKEIEESELLDVFAQILRTGKDIK